MTIMGSWVRKSNKTSVLVVVLAAAALAIALVAIGCGQGLRGGSTTTSTIPALTTVVTQGPGQAGPGVSGPSTGARIVLKDGKADPNHYVIQVGIAVTFVNMDDDLPAAQENHHIVADDGSFDSGVLEAANFYSVTFQKPGTFAWHDVLHPEIKGEIVVE
jgi:plastocyanin